MIFFKVYNRIYKIYCLKENNEYLEQITKNESQIIEIEDMVTRNYCVVVPRSLEDLIVEGQQQNNWTVEYRGFNNSEIMDEEVLSFLDKIDYRLRSILKG